MAAQAQDKLQKAMEEMLGTLEKSTLRPMQKNGYLCSAKCFDNDKWDAQQMQQCVERCQNPLAQGQQVLNNELNQFQERIQRCSLGCQDQARDQMPADGQPDEKKMAKIQDGMDKCITNCADVSIKSIPAMKKRLETQFKHL